LVKVRFYAWLRESIGRRELIIDDCPETLLELFLMLRKILGEKARAIFDDDHVRSEIMIGVNNVLIKKMDIGNIKIRKEDVVDIMPMGSGG